MTTEPSLDDPAPAKPLKPGRILLPFAVVFVFVAAIMLIWDDPPAPTPTPFASSTIKVEGVLTLSRSFIDQHGMCQGKGGYNDIRQGTQVTVYDGGTVVGTGSLQLGLPVGTGVDSRCD